MSSVLRLQHASVPMPAGGAGDGRKFYGEALGMTEVEAPKGMGPGPFVWFRAGDDGHEIHLYTQREDSGRSPGQHFCLQVDDPDAFRRRLEEHGYVTEDTAPIRNRPRFFTMDPFGNRVEIAAILGDYLEQG